MTKISAKVPLLQRVITRGDVRARRKLELTLSDTPSFFWMRKLGRI